MGSRENSHLNAVVLHAVGENEIGIYVVIYLFFLSVDSAGTVFLISSFIGLPCYLLSKFYSVDCGWDLCVIVRQSWECQ